MTNFPKSTRTMQLILAVTILTASTANAKQAKLKFKARSAENLSGLVTEVANLSMAAGQVKDDLFAGAEKFAQGASEVTEINLDPSTMGMISHGYFPGKQDTLASKMNFMVIHSYKYDKPGMYSMEDFEAYSKKLTDGTWNCSIHVRSKTASTDICSRTGADHETNEMVILTAAPRDITFIHMSGKMSLADLNRMSEGSHGIILPVMPRTPSVPAVPSPSPAPAPAVTIH